LRIDFDTLGERANPLSIFRTLCPFSVSTGLIADRLQLGNAILQYQAGEIGDAVFEWRRFSWRCDYLTSTPDRIGLGCAP